jgi:hypothetical protein
MVGHTKERETAYFLPFLGQFLPPHVFVMPMAAIWSGLRRLIAMRSWTA